MDCNSVDNTEGPDVLCTLMLWSSKLPFAQWKSPPRLPCTLARYRTEKDSKLQENKSGLG